MALTFRAHHAPVCAATARRRAGHRSRDSGGTEDGTSREQGAGHPARTGRAGGEEVGKDGDDTSKGQKAPKARAGAQEAKRPSGLDAAAKVLAEAGEPLSCKAIVECAFEKGYWKTSGKTPAATIYAAIIREIQTKGEGGRFKKVARGRFALAK